MSAPPLHTSRPQSVSGEFPSDTTVPLLSGENEALQVDVTTPAELIDWTYSQTAEDNGIVGEMNDEAGIIYNGISGMSVRVIVSNLDLASDGIIAPTAGDNYIFGVYVNSTLVGESDEGALGEYDTETVEHNIDFVIHDLQETDVIRFAPGLVSGTTGSLEVEEASTGQGWTLM